MSPQQLHNALLRPAVLHILRATGYHAARPSVIDTLTDIAVRYLILLASRTQQNAYSNHNTPEPDITDVRMAMQECGLLIPSMTAAEEEWSERLRKPLQEYPDRIRDKERQRRDAEDTRDVRAFIEWVGGKKNMEIRRIAGLSSEGEGGPTVEQEVQEELEDYLTALKKKHSKTGEETRFQGTILGKPADEKPIKIEGGPIESIRDWIAQVQEQAARQSVATGKIAETDASEDVDMDDESVDFIRNTGPMEGDVAGTTSPTANGRLSSSPLSSESEDVPLKDRDMTVS
ncbi:hypothetical protein EJ05DRAFT_74298 [Pseudovirgaria hyperparasitica]|uniref:Bromodomain associated domain-containing protein n=1 Tax=Pseudovirgaria hyperparasitica TaxID=470096 RepID=A0A6A6W474_9PEZI|nr:uncharacterized protein EJ05DRAFT_74298 [Pseudovirgaria hyperparasitica]KAF2756710.1 hypothetical protein EJ05DRAFT_74298 [Pseudovirgaria hyperparasitica]